jgi:hypothetical protein
MSTVRRTYFYLVALIGLEVVVWGVINLARTLFDILPGGGSASMLAGGLSLIIVGLPIFLLHWHVLQREANSDAEERNTRLRALFLYTARLATLIPVVQNIGALLNRPLLNLMDQSTSLALFGSGQIAADNLVAILANGIAFYYFERVLQNDWKLAHSPENLTDTRRLYRYVWMLYTLILATAGVIFTLRYALYLSSGPNTATTVWLANGLTLVLVYVPLWAWAWQTIEKTRKETGQYATTLRFAALYLLALTGAFVTLGVSSSILADLLRALLGEAVTLTSFLSENGERLAIVLALGVVWIYFGRRLSLDIAAQAEVQRRAALLRFYRSILALAGNVAVFTALWRILDVMVDVLLQAVDVTIGRGPLSSALGLLIVGLPLWLRTWQPLQAEATATHETGDHARRSVARKGYLYLVLFLTVVGAMVSAGMLFYLIFNQLLGNPPEDFAADLARSGYSLVLTLLWLSYHLRALRADNSLSHHAISNQHAIFPTLVIQGSDQDEFTAALRQALERRAPRLPVAIRNLESDSLDESLTDVKAVVLPADIALQPPESLRLWLKHFSGQRLLVPLAALEWILLNMPERGTSEIARQTADALADLAEGQQVRPAPSNNPWSIVGYVLGALFGIIILFSVLLGVIDSLD